MEPEHPIKNKSFCHLVVMLPSSPVGWFYARAHAHASFTHFLQESQASQVAKALAGRLTVDSDRPDAAAKDARAADILAAVYSNANQTLTAIQQTAAALDAVEIAAEAVERAKGSNDVKVRNNALHELLFAAPHVDTDIQGYKQSQGFNCKFAVCPGALMVSGRA